MSAWALERSQVCAETQERDTAHRYAGTRNETLSVRRDALALRRRSARRDARALRRSSAKTLKRIDAGARRCRSAETPES